MNIIGGRSSRYHDPGMSIRSVSVPRTSGFIQSSALLRIVDLGPAVANPHIERVEIVVHQGVVVLDALRQQQARW